LLKWFSLNNHEGAAPMKKHVTVPAPATIDSIALDKVTGGAGTWKDMRDGAGNSGSKGSGSRRGQPGPWS
jgi:hypothetical protein